MTDPWGNPLSPDDQRPVNPQPEDYPPDFAPNPALPGAQTPETAASAAAPPPLPIPALDQSPASPPAWPGTPPPPQPAWQGPKFSGMAIASMVCGILSITCTGFLGIVLGPTALGLGLTGRKAIAGSNGWKKGDGMAIAGIVTGVIGIVLSIVYLIFLIRNPNFITDFVDNLTTTTTTGEKLQGA
jgi:hypothetical protein